MSNLILKILRVTQHNYFPVAIAIVLLKKIMHTTVVGELCITVYVKKFCFVLPSCKYSSLIDDNCYIIYSRNSIQTLNCKE